MKIRKEQTSFQKRTKLKFQSYCSVRTNILLSMEKKKTQTQLKKNQQKPGYAFIPTFLIKEKGGGSFHSVSWDQSSQADEGPGNPAMWKWLIWPSHSVCHTNLYVLKLYWYLPWSLHPHLPFRHLERIEATSSRAPTSWSYVISHMVIVSRETDTWFLHHDPVQ